MDFYQNAARKQSNSESAEYEIINIEFQGKDQPFFEYGNYNEEYHEPITSLSKQYLDEFQHQDDNFTYYKVEQNDSIYGLELKFEISALQILRLNNISENSIYPGMILKIPIQEQTKVLEQHQENNEIDSDSVAAQYITQIGAIFGQCSITKHCLKFIADKNNKQNEELIFNANIRDIENLTLQILFKHILIAEEQALEQFLPIIKMQNKKNSVITIYAQTKKQKIVIIKLLDDKLNEEFINKINNSVADFFEHQEQYFLSNALELKTVIPFHFEASLIIENNVVQPKEQQQKQQQQQQYQPEKQEQKQQQQIPKQICHDSLQTKLVTMSDIISQEQFINISYHLPFLFKGQKWECIYSSIKNGSSILTLMRKSENRYPVVVVVKDVESYMFGGYLSDGIKNSGGKFYGNGESFLFTFKNDQQIQVYKWTHINNYFTLCDRDGLAIGCGDKYGLYINSEISNGYSCQCDTYGNEILSKKQNFIIDRLEIWSISYH